MTRKTSKYPATIIAVDQDLLSIYNSVAIQEKSLSNWGFFLALSEYLAAPWMVAKKGTWYPALISASILYRRAKLRYQTLSIFGADAVYTDCKGCNKVTFSFFSFLGRGSANMRRWLLCYRQIIRKHERDSGFKVRS